MGLGLGLKLSRSQSTKKDPKDEDPWYIPYNGPYEPPRQSSQRAKARDSWGDPIDDEDDELDESLGVEELRKRFGGGHNQHAGSGDIRPADVGKKGARNRSTSLASGRSASSGVDPMHGSSILHQRSIQRPPIPSYITLDTSGGVGESPMPHASTREPIPSSRISLGSIFSFNSSHRKSFTASPKNGDTRKPRPPKLKTQGDVQRVAVQLGPISSSSSESQGDSPRKLVAAAAAVPVPSTRVDDDDYYNSYYGTLLKGPVPQVSPEHPQFGVNPRAAPRPDSGSTASQQGTFSSHSIHPYAFTFPRKDPESPAQDPPHSARDPPRLAFVSPPARITAKGAFNDLGLKQVKNASSTPNLRSPPRSDAPRVSDRWLSARNWCDAILFPRPRLRIKEELLESHHIISPPTTPLTDSYAPNAATAVPVSALQSRVLAHSRSLVDLATSSKRQQPAAPPPSRPSANDDRPPRPKSFAQDDLALLRPVLSLEKVIEEGQELDKQRRQWKQQATSSIGNTRARNLSRTRSKSLTQKGRIGGHRAQTSFDYLAARACLGSQNLTPVLPARSHTVSFSDATGALSSIGRSSHTHSNSISKSKASQTHSRGHSKNESWSNSVAKSGDAISPVAGSSKLPDDRLAGLEGALRRDETRALPAPTTIVQPIDHPYANHSPADRFSPTPSGSDIRMGIAISTPPLTEDTLDRELIRMPSHPYAHAGLVSSAARVVDQGQTASYAAAPPPVAFMSPHPYAHPYAIAEPDDGPAFVAQVRSDSVDPQHKMWAQLSPGVVREILPSDLRRYSPFFVEAPAGDRSSVVGVGEALEYTNRDSRDSGLGTSEYVPSVSPMGMQRFTPKFTEPNRPHREPVRYDASKPSYVHHRGRSADMAQIPRPVPPPSHTDHAVRPGLVPVSPSPGLASGTPSPDSPHSLGSPNDLESFHDLFYKPNTVRPSLEDHAFTSSSSGAVLTGDMSKALRSRGAGSGLTGLARKLSEEFEQMERHRERTDSQYSRSSGSIRRPPSLMRRTTESSLQFVLDAQRTTSPTPEENEEEQDAEEIFRPPFAVPEDVHSSNSSFVERTVEDEDDTARMRVGVVESVSTPPAETAARRGSYTGFLSEDPEHLPIPQSLFEKHQSRLLSPISPNTDATRSSYMTTSTLGSRMSNLSDFPVPPSLPSHHNLSLATSTNSPVSPEIEFSATTSHPMYPHDRRFTFGIDQDAADVAEQLSNPDH